jgi:hypothetical protein
MDEAARIELVKIAHARAPQYQSVRDVMTHAEALAIWVTDRRFPEEPVAAQPLQGGL